MRWNWKVVLAAAAGVAMTAGTAMAQEPTARQVLDQGLKVTGLAGADAPAYHVKANYALYDIRSGKVTESGTLEAWQSADGVWHREYTEKKNVASVWSTSTTDRVSTKSPRLNLVQLDQQVAQPLLDPLHLAERYPANLELTGQAGTFGGEVLNCVTVTYPVTAAHGMSPDLLFPRYCFEAKTGALHVETTSTVMTSYTEFKTLGSREVATKVEVKPYNRLGTELEITTLEPLAAGSDAMVKPGGKTEDFPLAHEPGDAPLVPVSIHECEYPIDARSAGDEHGVVTVPVIIGKDGKVKSNGHTFGPPHLTQAAQDCVTGYKFQPYLVNGKPTEVSDTILYNYDGKPYTGLNGTVTIASQAPAH